MIELLRTGDPRAPCHMLLSHGAGAPMASPFMDAMAAALAAEGIGSTRFEFVYMASRHRDGSKRPPPKADVLCSEFLNAVAVVEGRLEPGQRLVIGGKSMGGRVASMVADGLYREGRIGGLVCLGYPFRPPARKGQGQAKAEGEAAPDQRIAHLKKLTCPALVIQGERDPFGGRSEVAAMELPPGIAVHWSPDGDHDLRPRSRSGATHAGNLTAAAEAIAAFCRQRRGA